MDNFIAMDFETANRNRHSICAVGMVFVEDGKITNKLYQLINPEEDFDGINIGIHGITPDMVEGASTFDVFYNATKDKLNGKLLVAHYLAFDGYALSNNIQRYKMDPVPCEFLCTYQLAKRLYPGMSSYSIKSLCHHFEIDLFKHHHALEDALACAKLFQRLVSENNLSDYNDIYLKTYIKPGELNNKGYRSSLVDKSKPPNSDTKIS